MTEREVSESPLTLEDARNHMRRIADARDWGQYHTPLNLQLALVGEVGELCEIFQWKSFCKPSLLSEEERSHLGQELSDVIAYSTRLADRCGIDLAASLTLTVNNKLLLNCCCSHEENKPWVNLSFDNVSLPSTHAVARGYPRHMCLLLSAAVGNLSRIFSEKNELQCDIGLPGWTIEDRTLIATSLASIIFSVVSIAVYDSFYFNPTAECTISLGEAFRNKMALNENKYPVHLAKGRSDKYSKLQSPPKRYK